jgi:hypothetical protein
MYKRTLNEPNSSFKVIIATGDHTTSKEFTIHKDKNTDMYWFVTESNRMDDFLMYRTLSTEQRIAHDQNKSDYMRTAAINQGLITMVGSEVHYALDKDNQGQIPTSNKSRKELIKEAKAKAMTAKKEEKNTVKSNLPSYVSFMDDVIKKREISLLQFWQKERLTLDENVQKPQPKGSNLHKNADLYYHSINLNGKTKNDLLRN